MSLPHGGRPGYNAAVSRREPTSLFPILAGDVAGLLRRAQAARGIAAQRFAVDRLEQALAWADPGVVDAALRARALSLGVSPDVVESTERTAPLHAVRIPLVDTSEDPPRALLRTFFASFDAAPSATPRLEDDTDHALREAFERARSEASDPRVRPIRWVAAQPRALEAITVAGESLAAGALVSAYALLTGRAVRPGVVVTGTLRGGKLGAVGHLDLKVQAAESAGAKVILVPKGEPFGGRRGALEVRAVGSITELLEAALERSAEELDVEGLVRQAKEQASRGWRGFRWPEALELLERATLAVPDGDLDTRVDLLARLGAAERHAGSLSRSDALLARASALAASKEGLTAVTDLSRSQAHRQRAMTLLRLCQLGPAAREAERGLRTARRARSRREQVKALGVVGLVARGVGDESAAIAAFREALALDLLQSPHHVARSRAYLLESLARNGALAEARAEFDAALAETTARGSRSDEAWVRTAYGAGLIRGRRPADALGALDVPVVHDAILRDPMPGLSARRHLGTALLSAGSNAFQRERGRAFLLGALDGHGRTLEPGLRQLAALALLVGCLEGQGTEDTLHLALRSFVEGPLAEEAEQLTTMRPGKKRDEALASLVERLDRLP